MKKSLILIIFFIFSLFFSSFTQAGFSVFPAELPITMENTFLKGNTTKKITIENNNPGDFNVTWYIEHPYENKIRPNRTYMPSLNWIVVNPKYIILPPGATGDFYIYLNIPETEENLNQNWEVWVTFKQGQQDESPGIFKQEFAIRTYIDTPKIIDSENEFNDGLYATTGENTQIITSVELGVLIIIILSLLIIVFIIYKKRKKNR